jgi:hypothetical protein
VKGAVVSGTAAPGAEVIGRVAFDTLRSEAVEFQARAVADAAGAFSLRVPQPGLLELRVGGVEREVTVSEEAVERGERVSIAQ